MPPLSEPRFAEFLHKFSDVAAERSSKSCLHERCLSATTLSYFSSSFYRYRELTCTKSKLIIYLPTEFDSALV